MLQLYIAMLGRRRSEQDPLGEVIPKQYLSSARDLLGVNPHPTAVEFLAKALHLGRRHDGLNALRTAIEQGLPFDQLQLPEVENDLPTGTTVPLAADEAFAVQSADVVMQPPTAGFPPTGEGLSPA